MSYMIMQFKMLIFASKYYSKFEHNNYLLGVPECLEEIIIII